MNKELFCYLSSPLYVGDQITHMLILVFFQMERLHSPIKHI
jgi:hypothetical protein